ncbi:MAG: hypothetical protein ACYC7D_12785 [Nitrososphaerales archaeon]
MASTRVFAIILLASLMAFAFLPLLIPAHASGGVTIVQQVSAGTGSCMIGPCSNSYTATLSNVAAGDVLVVSEGALAIGNYNPHLSVSDNISDSYTKFAHQAFNASGNVNGGSYITTLESSIWSATATASGAVTITITVNSNMCSTSCYLGAVVYELSGASANPSVSGSQAYTSLTTSATSTQSCCSVSPSLSPASGSVIIAGVTDNPISNPSWTAGSGFTLSSNQSPGQYIQSEYLAGWPAGSSNAPMSEPNSAAWTETAAGFSPSQTTSATTTVTSTVTSTATVTATTTSTVTSPTTVTSTATTTSTVTSPTTVTSTATTTDTVPTTVTSSSTTTQTSFVTTTQTSTVTSPTTITSTATTTDTVPTTVTSSITTTQTLTTTQTSTVTTTSTPPPQTTTQTTTRTSVITQRYPVTTTETSTATSKITQTQTTTSTLVSPTTLTQTLTTNLPPSTVTTTLPQVTVTTTLPQVTTTFTMSSSETNLALLVETFVPEGTPISGSVVNLTSSNFFEQAVTNASGAVFFTGLNARKYNVSSIVNQTLLSTPINLVSNATVVLDPSALETSALATLSSSTGTTTVPLTFFGNETGVEITQLHISLEGQNNTYLVSFQISGTAGTVGFANVTIPKSAVPSGYTPTVYVDGARALDQSYAQDQNNYYVYFTTHFSTHHVLFSFTQGSSTATTTTTSSSTVSTGGSSLIPVATIAIIMILFGAIFVRRKRDKEKSN